MTTSTIPNSLEQDYLISDIFFHLAPMLCGNKQPYSSDNISELAGLFSRALNDCGINLPASKIREDFFDRL